MTSEPTVQEQLGKHFLGAWVLTSLEIASNRGLVAALAEGGTVESLADAGRVSVGVVRGLIDVFAAQGWIDASNDRVRWTDPARTALAVGAAGAFVQSDVHTTLEQHSALWRRVRDPGDALEGWRAIDPEVVEAQARHSEAANAMILPRVAGMLPGLAERLAQDGAAILDVGAGGAGGAIAFARMFPTVRVVGMEPSPIALACAERLISGAGVNGRIEMRGQLGDKLVDENRYALAYVAQMFFPDAAWKDAAARVFRALEPGGYFITLATCRDGADLGSAVSRLRTALWGGGRRFADAIVRDLQAAGFPMAQVAPVPPGTMAPVFARKGS